ncbi:MAG: peptidase domain-containing ABC transporter [Candidatus Melainabacteria bacterium]|nr:peptidase domain-containing ABC transporter [Candidatus Melainabacteria bacterium]
MAAKNSAHGIALETTRAFGSPEHLSASQSLPDSSLAVGSWDSVLQACYRHVQKALRHRGGHRFADVARGDVQSLESLAQHLQDLGFSAKIETLSWNALLKAPFPRVVQMGTEAYWVTRRQGAALHAQIGPKTTEIEQHQCEHPDAVRTLRILPQPRTWSVNQPDAFSLRWYAGLFLANGLFSTQMFMASFMAQVFTLAVPLFYMVIFDRVFGRQNLATLDVMAIGMILVLTFQFLVRYLRVFVLSYVVNQVDRLTVDLFLDGLFHLQLKDTLKDKARLLADHFGTLTRLNQVVGQTLLMTSLDMLFSAVIVGFLLMLDFQLAVISLLSLVPIAVQMFWSVPNLKRKSLAFEKEQRQYRLRLSEVLEHAETLKSLDAEGHIKRSIRERFKEEVLPKSYGPRFDRLKMADVQQFLALLSMLVTLYFGAHRVLEGVISFGVYIAINMLSRQIISNAQKLLENLAQFNESLGSLEQFRQMQADADATALGAGGEVLLDSVKGDIQLVDVGFRYSPEAPMVLKHVSCHIQPGQKVILAGRSGAGKTTLIRLLQRLYSPTEGYILVDGVNTGDVDVESLRDHVGVAVQKVAMFSGTIRDNIAVGYPNAPMKAIVDAASMAQLDQYVYTLPNGFETPVEALGTNLSGGQAARISLARTFLRNPSILILDEAINALEPALKGAVLQQLMTRYRERTCLLVTDFQPAHQLADLILVLHDGHIVEQGRYEDLMAAQGFYYHLYQQEANPAPVSAVTPLRPSVAHS